MQTTTLGATGRTVSVAGLGCGGSSKIGMSRGMSEAQSVRLVRSAFEEGVTFIDTAEAYGTEAIVGAALKELGDRDGITVSTKSRYRGPAGLMRAAEVI
ncbi:MAG: aldo/keto reductase, partial [Pseudomonadota bacterium]